MAPSISFALECSAELDASQIEFLESVWPGHVTVIVQANDSLSLSIKSIDNSIAIRVSSHLPVINLLNIFNDLMVSTSANISNFPTPKSLDEVKKSSMIQTLRCMLMITEML